MCLLLTPKPEDLHPLMATPNTWLFGLLNLYHDCFLCSTYPVLDMIEAVPQFKRLQPSSKCLLPSHLLPGGWDLHEMEVSLHPWCLHAPISSPLPLSRTCLLTAYLASWLSDITFTWHSYHFVKNQVWIVISGSFQETKDVWITQGCGQCGESNSFCGCSLAGWLDTLPKCHHLLLLCQEHILLPFIAINDLNPANCTWYSWYKHTEGVKKAEFRGHQYLLQ